MNFLNQAQLVKYLRSKNPSCMTADYFESLTHDECDGYPVIDDLIDEAFVKRHMFGLIIFTEEAEQAWRELKANVTTHVFLTAP